MSRYLEEYLVGLGFNLDTVGYHRFAAMLRDSQHLVDGTYLGMTKSVLQFEASAISAFAALGAGIVTFADKTAMADQEYRLLALRMFTSLPVARELKIALDALGQPLENVIWDPELAARFHQLVADQKIMTRELGPDFEKQMLRIRDVRFEFSRLGVELKYLSMLFVEDLAKAMGTDVEGLLEKLRQFNDYLIHNLPQISAWLVSNLKPILADVKDIMGDLWAFTKNWALAFTNLVAFMMGNKALEGQAADAKKFGEALRIVAHGLANIVDDILNIGGNIGLLFDAAVQASKGNYKAALSDLSKMKVIGHGQEAVGPAAAGEAAGKATRDWVYNLFHPTSGAPAATGTADIKSLIAAQADFLGLPPSLALAVAQVESGFRQFDKSGNVLMPDRTKFPDSHAMGIFQLQPGTARRYGVDPTNTRENIAGGVSYLRDLLRTYGNEEAALEHYYGSKDPAKNRAYAEQVMRVEAGMHIEHLSITVPPGADHQGTKNAVTQGITDAERQRVQRMISEFNKPAWGY